MAQLISIEDLNTEVNDEPRVSHKKLAQVLEYDQPHKLKHLIDRNKEELLQHGIVSSAVDETTKSGGRPSRTYYLNEAQALLVSMFSRTDKAAEVRKAVIEVFMAYRRGELVQATICAEQQRQIQEAVNRKVTRTNQTHQAVYHDFKTHFKIPRYDELPASQFDEAMRYLNGSPLPVPAAERQKQAELIAAYMVAKELYALVENEKVYELTVLMHQEARKCARAMINIGELYMPELKDKLTPITKYVFHEGNNTTH